MSDISTQYYDQLTSLQNQLMEQYGIDDLDLFTSEGNLDLDLLNDANLSPFFQLAVLQLAEILEPTKINSDSGEVTIDDLPDILGDELYQFIIDTITDDPELMAYFSGSESEATYIMGLLDSGSYDSSSATTTTTQETQSYESASDDARRINEEWDLDESIGGGYSWFIETEDAYNAGIWAILDRLDQISQAKLALSQAMLDPEASETTLEQLSLEYESAMNSETSLFSMLGQFQDQVTTLAEMMTKLIEAYLEAKKGTVKNFL